MTKGNKISDVEIYCIEKMVMEGKSVEEISNFLKRDSRTIKKYSDNVEIPEHETVEEESSKRYAKSDKNSTHFVHKTGSKNNQGVTIMTPNESARADETRSLRLSKNTKKNIHTISENE
ncbi:MAG: hypothetical protein HWN81_09440 [Candidatus Lokiarchaeota archaeon]|jgi:predicted metal-dependent hydrolase|nr:hypothetical protein [Candidatus Lokiarchaeota archaeon]